MAKLMEIRRCSHCDEEVEEKSFGNDGVTVCPGCKTIEGNTYVVLICCDCMDEDVSEEHICNFERG